MSFRRPVLLTAVAVLIATGVLTGSAAATPTSTAPAAAPSAPSSAVVAPAGPSAAVAALAAHDTSTAAATAARGASAALSKARPPCAVRARACVDLSAKKAWLTDGAGRITYGPVPVLGGRRGEPTPVGTFAVSHRVRDYHSRQFDAPMPYSVFFVPGVAFHQGSLSTRSAGCLHLSRTSAKKFFAELGRGDPVQIVG